MNLSSFRIVNTYNRAVVRGDAKPGSCLLYNPTADHRPKLSNLVALKPGEPLVWRIDVGKILVNLPDRNYSVQFRPQGAWWCFGTPEEVADKDDNRVPRRLHKTTNPPLLLETRDMVDLEIHGGIYVMEGRYGAKSR